VPRRNVMVVVFDAPKMAVPGTVAGVQLVAVSKSPRPRIQKRSCILRLSPDRGEAYGDKQA
jgi:hypothetical protein